MPLTELENKLLAALRRTTGFIAGTMAEERLPGEEGVVELYKLRELIADAERAADDNNRTVPTDCAYPTCLNNEDERCPRWLLGTCSRGARTCAPDAGISGGPPTCLQTA